MRGSPDWDTVFDGFSATVDYPSCTYWRELAEHYPDAKVILSTRDADDWFNSVHQTILSPENVKRFRTSPMAEFMEGTILKSFGDGINDREFMVDHFQRWEASVIEALPPERLLVHRPGDGWKPLCDFLGMPVPDQPYPRVNTTEDMTGSGITRKQNYKESGPRSYMDAMRAKAFD